MLIQFAVKNYKLFKELNTISLVASNYDKTNQENNTVFNRKINTRLLKSAVLYGANASGKSKFFEAYGVFRQLVLNSSKESQADERIDVTPFLLDRQTEKEPTSFEIIFLLGGIQYRYGYEVTKDKINREWFYTKEKDKEDEVFYRRNNRFIKQYENEIAINLTAQNMVRSNALFLSVLAQFNDKTAKKVLGFLRKVNLISGLKHEGYEAFTVREVDTEKSIKKEEILNFLNAADFGIEDLKVSKFDTDSLPDDMPDKVKDFIKKNKREIQVFYQDLTAYRRKYDDEMPSDEVVPFSMDNDESSGTKKYFALSGPIIDTLKNGSILFIDELDSQLHPRLVRHLIELFNSKANTKNAQLIFNTHDVNLLNASLFRRDQIWFTEKNKFGAAHLYSLADIKIDDVKKIRKDENYEKNYLAGKYGAVPYISEQFETINSDNG